MQSKLNLPQTKESAVCGTDLMSVQIALLGEERRTQIKGVFRANPLLAHLFENAVTDYTVNPATGLIVSEGIEYANIDRIRTFVRIADLTKSSLPTVADGFERLWRGNRPGEIGLNHSFTNSLVGIALPFMYGYGGKLSYVDVPIDDLVRYVCRIGSATDSEFMLSPQLAARAVAVEGIRCRTSVHAVELYLRYVEQGGTPEVGLAKEWLSKHST